MLNIKFKSKDENLKHLNNRAYKVIYEVINNQDKKYLLDGFLDCIITNIKLNNLTTDFSEWKKKYDKDPYKSEKQDLINYLSDYLLVNNDIQKNYDKKRGYIFELFLYEIMKHRYSHHNDRRSLGCNVIINESIIMNEDRQTVDFAGWDGSEQKGEFYEAKVRPSTFDDSTINFLNFMRQELDKYETDKVAFLLACVSMFSKRDLNRELKSKSREILIDGKISLYGKEDYFNLGSPQI